LHHAYIQNQNTIVNLLLENGSYTRKTDLFGKIPSDYKNLNGNIKQESNSFESLNVNTQINEIKLLLCYLYYIFIII